MVSSIFGIYHPDMCGRLSLKLWSSCRFKLIQSPTSSTLQVQWIVFFQVCRMFVHEPPFFWNKDFDSHSFQGFTNFFLKIYGDWLPVHYTSEAACNKLRWWRTRWWDVSEVLYKLLQMSSTKNRLPPCHEAKKKNTGFGLQQKKKGPLQKEQLMDFLIVL